MMMNATRMTNIEARMMNDEILMTNQFPNDSMTIFRHSCFVIDWSFVLRHSSFLD